MNKIYRICFVMLLLGISHGVSDISKSQVKWSDLDRIPDPRIKAAFLNQLFPTVKSNLFPDRATLIDYSLNFNILDFDGDRVLDIVYHGPTSKEDSSETFKLYKNDKKNGFSLFYDFKGEALNLNFKGGMLSGANILTSDSLKPIKSYIKYDRDTTNFEYTLNPQFEITLHQDTKIPSDFSFDSLVVDSSKFQKISELKASDLKEEINFTWSSDNKNPVIKLDRTKTPDTKISPIYSLKDSFGSSWSLVLITDSKELKSNAQSILFDDKEVLNDENSIEENNDSLINSELISALVESVKSDETKETDETKDNLKDDTIDDAKDSIDLATDSLKSTKAQASTVDIVNMQAINRSAVPTSVNSTTSNDDFDDSDFGDYDWGSVSLDSSSSNSDDWGSPDADSSTDDWETEGNNSPIQTNSQMNVKLNIPRYYLVWININF